MPGRQKNAGRGFTLVELLVVLTIIGVLAAIAVPGILRLLPQSSLSDGSRDVFRLLRAAQVYAATYNVKTAVVYGLDNYVAREIDPSNTAPLRSPIADPVTGETVRVFATAAIMYELPETMGPYAGKYVSVPGDNDFRPFAGNAVVLLRTPLRDQRAVPGVGDVRRASYEEQWEQLGTSTPRNYYFHTAPRFEPAGSVNPAPLYRLGALGLSTINAYMNETGPYVGDSAAVPEPFPAHVFTPQGRLLEPNRVAIPPLSQDEINQGFGPSPGLVNVPERITIWVGPDPTEAPDDQIIGNAGNLGTFNEVPLDGTLRNVPIYIYQSTGRIRMAER